MDRSERSQTSRLMLLNCNCHGLLVIVLEVWFLVGNPVQWPQFIEEFGIDMCIHEMIYIRIYIYMHIYFGSICNYVSFAIHFIFNLLAVCTHFAYTCTCICACSL